MSFAFEANLKITYQNDAKDNRVIIFVSIYIILSLSFAMAKLKIYWFCSAQFHMHEKSADSISHRRKV